MTKIEIEQLKGIIQRRWSYPPSVKAQNYVERFFEQTRQDTKIKAKVEGNHGTYTVSIKATDTGIDAACSCYIGSDGYCHHCEALALTFINNAEAFKLLPTKTKAKIKTLEDIHFYLQGVTLDYLLKELQAKGITQKAFAESIGMNARHLSSIKSSELKNRYYHELGATKLACLWVAEHCKSTKT